MWVDVELVIRFNSIDGVRVFFKTVFTIDTP